MTNLDIRVDTKKLTKYLRASKSSVDEETMMKLVEKFSSYLRSLYLQLIYEEIHNRRYRGHWEPVTEIGYLEYLDTTPTIDIYDLIEEALEVSKVGSNFLVRFRPSYRYPGSRRPLILVLRAIECGTTDFNARPLLYKCVKSIESHMYDLWKGYLAVRGVI